LEPLQEAALDLPVAQDCEALVRFSRTVGAHGDSAELFRNLPGDLRRVAEFDALAVVAQDENSGTVSVPVVYVDGSGETALPLDGQGQEAVLGWIRQHRAPIVISVPEEEGRIPVIAAALSEAGMRTLCAVPLDTAHRRLGSIVFGRRQAAAYPEREVRFLSLAADRAALAIAETLSSDASRAAQSELRNRNERLKLLLELNNSIISHLELRDLLRAVSASVRRVMRCDSVGVALPDPEGGQLRIHAVDFPRSRGVAREEGTVPTADEPINSVFHRGEPLVLDAPGLARLDEDSLAVAEGIQALCDVPLPGRKGALGVLCLGRLEDNPFTADDLEFLRQVAGQVAIAVENALAYRQIAELKDRLAQEKLYLEDEFRTEMHFEEIVGRSPALQKVLHQVETVAPTDSTVLIYGETGAGKELVARAIHNLSSRAKNAFVRLNCAAIPTGLLESEMFGHEKGAFTGAIAQRIGRFELANHGTVLLDEVGEIPLELQPKLLRVLQEREFERLGSARTLRTDARLIASTNRDLAAMVREQKFRMDLYYRLNVFPVEVPPLRERPEDIPVLVRHFARQFARRMNKTIDTIPSETMNVLARYGWPGNVRELQNLMERAVILSPGPVLKVPLADVQAQAAPAPKKIESLEDAERRTITEALRAARWVVGGPNGAAALLGLKRSTLQWRMGKLGIHRSQPPASANS
jgi:formate hydrogenlyase transcriptional activator